MALSAAKIDNVFFRNEGGGKFRDATKEAGLTLVAESETPCFFDMDGDGFVDLLVTNTARWTLSSYDETNRYYPGKAEEFDGEAPLPPDSELGGYLTARLKELEDISAEF